MSATWRFCYEGLTVISTVSEKSVRFRKVSAIKDVRFKKVSLYFCSQCLKQLFIGVKESNSSGCKLLAILRENTSVRDDSWEFCKR